jgi:type II secretory pathway pseudopilin PulG
MSLLNLILSQKIILFSASAALLLLFTALALMGSKRLRVARTKRVQAEAREQARLAAYRAARKASDDDDDYEDEDDDPAPRPRRKKPAGESAGSAKGTAPSGSSTQNAPVSVTTPAAASATTTASSPANAQPESPETAVSSAMQDILSSVFIDEEAMARYDVLLEGQEQIEMDTLLTLARQVAAELRPDSPASSAVKER